MILRHPKATQIIFQTWIIQLLNVFFLQKVLHEQLPPYPYIKLALCISPPLLHTVHLLNLLLHECNFTKQHINIT